MVDGGGWQRGAENVLGWGVGTGENERERTRGAFWLRVVVVREGFMVLVSLGLDQIWRWGLLKKAAPAAENSVGTGTDKDLAGE